MLTVPNERVSITLQLFTSPVFFLDRIITKSFLDERVFIKRDPIKPVPPVISIELLFNILPDHKNEKQRKIFISNIIREIAGSLIENIGSRTKPKWVLLKN